MSVFHNNALIGSGAGAAAAADFQIDRSLRFNDDDSAYLNRTPSSAGNRKTWTWSGWVKRSSTGGRDVLFSSNGGNAAAFDLGFDGSHRLECALGIGPNLVTSAVFRDFSAWMHIVVAVDTQQSTASNRIRIYVNGSEIDSFSAANYPAQDHQYDINNTTTHEIGRQSSNYFDGYLAEIHHVDGSQLAASDFGEYDDNNVWQAKEYSGTYGTNGFHLDFSDNSSNAALGTDSSGNSNTWTVNNFDAGAAVANLGFDVITYTGNGSTQTIGGLAFQPDFVWVKNRSRAVNHHVVDSVRGAVSSKVLYPNLNIGEGATNSFSAFTSDGFSVGANSSVNHSGDNLVAWCWKAGGTAASNTDGSITSSVSANPAYGFSIVSFTGDGSGTDTIGHGLNAAPKLIIVKDRDNTNDWLVYTDQIDGSWDFLKLNTSDAKSNSSYSAATSSVFSYGTDSTNYIAYCWSEVSGFSKFGSWTGNGSSSGPTVTLGFKPRLVIFKRTDTSGDNWTIFDTARDSGTLNVGIEANTNGAEQSFGNRQIVVSDTGFQVTSTGASSNENGGNYLYAAFADGNSAGIDSLIDTPTNYTANSGNNRGNYSTMNPLLALRLATLSNGNLDVTGGSLTDNGWGTIAVPSGKWYAEVTVTAGGGSTDVMVGVKDIAQQGSTDFGAVSRGYGYSSSGQKVNSDSLSSYAASYTNGDVIGIALDLDAGTITFYKNGSSQGAAFSGISSTYSYHFCCFCRTTSDTVAWNFGQRSFAYTPPSNHLAVCTTNLPDPTIADGSTAFDIDLYTGTNASLERSNFAFSPDFLWFKSRNAARTHVLIDTVRGRAKALESQSNGAEYTSDANRDLVSFDSDGFTVGQTQHFSSVNRSGDSIVVWGWDAGTSTVSNTDGSITSSVRASQTNGFSIVSYTGNGTAGATVGHGLSTAPEWVVCKDRDDSDNWQIYHAGAQTSGAKLMKFTTDGASSNNGPWNNTAPTNSVVTLGGGGTNDNNNDHIMYCWTPVKNFSSFGTYIGNNSTDGPFIPLSFSPAWVMVKGTGTSSTFSWVIVDSARSTFNPTDHALFPNSNENENDLPGFGARSFTIDLLSNGFKIRIDPQSINTDGQEYIYAAFAEHPFKTARAR